MAKLIYSALGSLDGYTADENGVFDWAAPDEQVHAYLNDIMRNWGTQLYGRRMYETLIPWETLDTTEASPAIIDFAGIWHGADKVVYSRTLDEVSSARTRLEREFDPDAVRAWKQSATRDLSIGGPELGAVALRAGLVDELHLFLNPVIVGGGLAALPDGMKASLELLDEHRFDNGVVHLRYRVLPMNGQVSAS